MKKLLILVSILAFTHSNSIGYVDIKGNIKNPGVYEIFKNETIQDVINKSGGLKNNSYTDNINLSKLVKDEMVIYIHKKSEINKQKELNNCDCSPIIKYIECDDVENNKVFKEEVNNVEITMSIPSTTTNVKIEPNITETIISKPNITTEHITTITSTTTTSKQEIITSTTLQPTTTLMSENVKRININYCTVEELITLKGLGESKAKSIIEYRNNNGLFSSIEDILNVSGIGNKTFENIKDFIEV